MSEQAAIRMRNTNRLVRLVAPFVFNGKRVTPGQLYGICKLTWVTQNPYTADAPYIQSTKIPALGEIFCEDFSGFTLDQVADRVSELLESPGATDVITQHTGFTNIRNVYRNAAKGWIHGNFRRLKPLFHNAFHLSSDDGGRALVIGIGSLGGIPQPKNPKNTMRAEYLLTPAFFSLDERKRFPLINGNRGVKQLLRALGASNAPLETQYERMIEMYGQGGITDAADLDSAGSDLVEIRGTPTAPPTKRLLKRPNAGADLPQKDDSDIQSLIADQTIEKKRLHNSLTNKLMTNLSGYVLYEGRIKDIMFDAMVKDYNGKKDDLLIEVKSSVDIAHIRMAVGQLYSYSYRLDAKCKAHLAILLPERPPVDVEAWLESRDIGLLWFVGNDLWTTTKCLSDVAQVA